MTDEKMPKKRVRRDWPKVLERFRSGDQNVRDFCAAEGIHPPLFYKWRRRLEERGSGWSTPPEGGFMELGSESERGVGVTIAADCGLRVELSPDFDATTLERVLGCLARGIACSR